MSETGATERTGHLGMRIVSGNTTFVSVTKHVADKSWETLGRFDANQTDPAASIGDAWLSVPPRFDRHRSAFRRRSKRDLESVEVRLLSHSRTSAKNTLILFSLIA